MSFAPAPLEILWQPLGLANERIPNRVICTATTLQYGRLGQPTAQHAAFYRERAAGGVGLLFTEQLTATPLSETAFSTAIHAYDRRCVPHFRRLMRALAGYDTRLFAQLVAGGSAGTSIGAIDRWGPLRGASRVPIPGGERPEPLSAHEIERLAYDFALSARNMRDAGVHGVELHGSHGWLIGQFLSPFHNRRDDEYGGPVANRCRLALEIGRAVRAEVGDDYPLGLSLTYDECIGQAGITMEDTEAQLEILSDSGLFDFFDLSLGASHSEHLTIASMTVAENNSFTASAKAMQIVAGRSAIFVAGRVVDIESAAAAVAGGAADAVAMTRAHLADPHLVRKARAGRAREATRCVGANVCVGRALRSFEVACVLNPITGREASWGEGTLTRTSTPRHIVVVGAGPAGLRVASTAAARGNHVTLYEVQSEPGGHLRELAWLPTRSRWRYAIEDMVSAFQREGGELILDCDPTGDRLTAGPADAIVIATGSSWDTDGATSSRPDRQAIAGIETGRVVGLGPALQIARDDRASFGSRVVIVDGTGSYAPLGLAEVLARRGAEVEFLTDAGVVGSELIHELELPHIMPRLFEVGVALSIWHQIDAVDGRQVVIRDIWSGRRRTIEDVDVIVLALDRSPRNELASFLQARGVHAHVVGDARTPRATSAVIHEAEKVARTL